MYAPRVDEPWITPPPVGFARPDGSTLPAPTWAADIGQAAGTFMTWSADGRYLAFDGYRIDEAGRIKTNSVGAPYTTLLIAQPSTGAVFTGSPEPLTPNALAGGPTWSPDGSRLAIPLMTSFMSEPALYIVTPDGKAPRKITPPGALFPSWSPTEKRLAFLQYLPSDHLCGPFFPDDMVGCDIATLKLLDLDSGAEATLLEAVHVSVEVTGVGAPYNSPAWHPNGQSLFVFYGNDTPDLVVVNTHGARSVLVPSVDRGSYIAVAPDGTSVVYVSRTTGDDEIFRLPLELRPYPNMVRAAGPELNLTNDPSSDINPVWSPDGRFLAFLSDRDRSGSGGYHLYTLDLLTGDVHRVSPQPVFTRPTWLPASSP